MTEVWFYHLEPRPLDAVLPMIEEFRKRRDFIYESLNNINGVKCFKPDGAFYAFPDISSYLGKPAPDGTHIGSSTDLCMYLIGHVGLALVPGDAFGEPNGIRLSYSASMETLEEGMERLKKGLLDLK